MTKGGRGSYFVFPGTPFYAQGPDNRWRLSIVDIDGTRLIVLVSYFEDSAQADLAAAEAIVKSMEVTP